MTHTQNRHVLRGGRVVVYTRDDVRDGVWQCSIRIPGLNKYVRKSTKTNNLEDAKQFAEDEYAKTLYMHQNDIPVFTKTFNQVADELVRKAKIDVELGRLSAGRVVLIEGTLDRYLRDLYGKKAITAITAKDIVDYEDYRLNYWKNKDGKKRPGNATDRPSSKTLQMEQSILRLVFKTAVGMGVITTSQVPYIEPIKAKTNRRPAFTLAEFQKLVAVAEKRIQETNHPRIKRERQLLWGYIRFMVHSGLRVGEARFLTFSAIEFFDDKDDTEYDSKVMGPRWLKIRVDGKTGKREAIGHERIKASAVYLYTLARKALIERGEYEEGFNVWQSDLYVFAKADGTVNKNFGNAFNELLKAAGLEFGEDGTKRTIYSLRHSYASFRIQYDNTDIYILSKTMGTSVKMIETHYGHVRTVDNARRISNNSWFIEKG